MDMVEGADGAETLLAKGRETTAMAIAEVGLLAKAKSDARGTEA